MRQPRSKWKNSGGNKNTFSSPNEQELELKPFSEVNDRTNGDLVKVKEQISADALTTMESELETDNEYKSKKSFLDIQKATDTNDKEGHQPQAHFSDSQSFGDSSMSGDINSFKQDRNEEHIEVQAQPSDSQSTGTSSTLDNNSLFRRDGNEDVKLQTHFSDSQSIGNSSVSDENGSFKKDRSYFSHTDSLSTVVENIQSEQLEVEDTPSDQLPQVVESLNTNCGRFVIHDDAHSSDLGPTSPATLPAGTQLDETPSDPVELTLRLDDDVDRTGLVESIASGLVSLSLIKDDACLVDSSDKASVTNSNDDEPNIHSDDLLQVSNDLELAHKGEGSDHSEIKMFRAEPPNENSLEVLVNRDIGSQVEDPVRPSMEEVNLNSGAMLALDCQNSTYEDCALATQLNSESPVVKIPPVSCFTGELPPDLTHFNTQDEPGSEEIEVLDSDLQSKFEEKPNIVHDDEINGSTCSVDPVEGDGHFRHPSPDNHVVLMFCRSHKKEVEVDEVVAGESLTELEEQKIMDQPEIASANAHLNLNRSVPCDLQDSETWLDTQQSVPIIHGQHDPFQNGRYSFSSPSGNQLESETDLEPFSQSHIGEQDA
ncbi:hypothetical protein VNO77_29316 [Canavalia gladiata]|uniref:Uncharacterized protein n=1 Tax=Canavalia gladiata TaxID=3824 RepID=A0AAN9L057_CANGL